MSLIKRTRTHWPEIAIEASALGIFMVSAGVFSVIIDHPRSLVASAITSEDLRRALIGVAMGLTAIAIIYSPWGKQSGAHMNPAITLTFLRLGKVNGKDALCYIMAQFVGGLIGVAIVVALLGELFTAPPVNAVLTVPGRSGIATAFAFEFAMSGILMSVVLFFSSQDRLAPYTGLAAGTLVALYITFEGPYSGMSMNPARSLASAAFAGEWKDLWIYCVAPPLGMLTGAALFGIRGSARCAKLHHTDDVRCIHCGYEPSPAITDIGSAGFESNFQETDR